MSYKHTFKRFSIYVPTKNMWSSRERWVVFETDAHRAIAKAYKQGKFDAIKEARNAEANMSDEGKYNSSTEYDSYAASGCGY